MPLVLEVRRQAPELVVPAAETPRETKRVSVVDELNAILYPFAFFFRGRGGGGGADGDPVSVIRRALGEALVHYYPLAGRVRDIGGGKYAVECTGEGVLLVQAEANVRLAELEAAGALRPPIPFWDQLLTVVEGYSGVVGCPLLHIQVTRLLCGGFVFALNKNHLLCDGFGIGQFLKAVGELARGLPSITVKPVWCRDLIHARDPPRPSFTLRGFKNKNLAAASPPPPAPAPAPGDKEEEEEEEDIMVNRSFTFRSTDMVAIKKSLPPPLRDTATTFEALSALLWRARTEALQFKPGSPATLVFPISVRSALSLPRGFYGCAALTFTVQVDAEVLRGGSLGDAVALLRLHKATAVNTEYVRSLIDELVLVGGRIWPAVDTFYLSDFRIGLNTVDLGWGVPVYAGPVDVFYGLSPFIPLKLKLKDQGGREEEEEDVLVVSVTLPRLAMDRFVADVESYVAGRRTYVSPSL